MQITLNCVRQSSDGITSCYKPNQRIDFGVNKIDHWSHLSLGASVQEGKNSQR